ncbi:hypothetical protein [Vibrio parahaemolyticus]|uniref:hypothetical protein n=1 Tax=Vibrio parahaemolyticus TaxID=670 RepID=UPI000C86AB58|nr:hypothetical protein [Vibrio parahaemolyticus]EIA1494022.1 hypothetical protein [Vibrio parahaemolyticus]ELA7319233.1 hypothetical protein [Vibrio parahaemolyticus]PMT62627.1 hypothetical protein C1S87_03625 [Vibrio parahaemolyticus]PMT89411.1 hypothetical protein C1S83_03625 [Vibrio parahaemolyticus]PMT92671.1 hypothetical protein C1T03_03625 [Vibrio parahaemolyticus]
MKEKKYSSPSELSPEYKTIFDNLPERDKKYIESMCKNREGFSDFELGFGAALKDERYELMVSVTADAYEDSSKLQLSVDENENIDVVVVVNAHDMIKDALEGLDERIESLKKDDPTLITLVLIAMCEQEKESLTEELEIVEDIANQFDVFPV